MTRILIVDDHAVVGEGTKAILDEEADFFVDVLTNSEDVTKRLAENEKYDIYILDLHMPGVNGLELTNIILGIQPCAKVMIYTGYDIAAHFNHLIQIGVSGFISKSSSSQQLIRAVRCTIDNQSVIPLELLHQLRRTEYKPVVQNGREIVLTQKEEEILLKVAKGRTNDQIAEELYMSRRSVERYLTGLFKKLNVSSRAETIRKAKEIGLISEILI